MRSLFSFAVLAIGVSVQSCSAQEPASRPHVIVTAEGKHEALPPEIRREDVLATIDRKPAQVSEWVKLAGDQAALQLYIVIDDGEDTDLGTQFQDLRQFIRAQPASTQIGLAYLRNGSAQLIEPLTNDHQKAAKSLRLPLGQPGISASPYLCLSDLFKKWPAAEARREVLLISSGIDPYYEPGPENPYLLTAIADAQRGSIVVHSIYYEGSGHMGHSYRRINWGQNYLSELGDGTGGEAYWQGLQSPVSFAPFLKDLGIRLENQYLLTFERGSLKAGLQNVKLSLEHGSGASLVTASRIAISK